MMEYYCFCNPKHVNMHAAAAVNVGYVGAGWFAAFIEKKWRWRVSIPLPLACKASALPFELHPLNSA